MTSENEKKQQNAEKTDKITEKWTKKTNLAYRALKKSNTGSKMLKIAKITVSKKKFGI